eukprot:s33_g73.t1
MGCDIKDFVAFFWPRQFGEQRPDGNLREQHPKLVLRISDYLPDPICRFKVDDVASLRAASSEFAEMLPKERLCERRQRPKAPWKARKSRTITAFNAFGGKYTYRSNWSGWAEYWESMYRDCWLQRRSWRLWLPACSGRCFAHSSASIGNISAAVLPRRNQVRCTVCAATESTTKRGEFAQPSVGVIQSLRTWLHFIDRGPAGTECDSLRGAPSATLTWFRTFWSVTVDLRRSKSSGHVYKVCTDVDGAGGSTSDSTETGSHIGTAAVSTVIAGAGTDAVTHPRQQTHPTNSGSTWLICRFDFCGCRPDNSDPFHRSQCQRPAGVTISPLIWWIGFTAARTVLGVQKAVRSEGIIPYHLLAAPLQAVLNLICRQDLGPLNLQCLRFEIKGALAAPALTTETVVAEPGNSPGSTFPTAMSGGHRHQHGGARRFRARGTRRNRDQGAPAGDAAEAEADEGAEEDWWAQPEDPPVEAEDPGLDEPQTTGNAASSGYFVTNDSATSSTTPGQNGAQSASAGPNGHIETTGPSLSANAPSFPDPSTTMSPIPNAWNASGGAQPWDAAAMLIGGGRGLSEQVQHGAVPPQVFSGLPQHGTASLPAGLPHQALGAAAVAGYGQAYGWPSFYGAYGPGFPQHPVPPPVPYGRGNPMSHPGFGVGAVPPPMYHGLCHHGAVPQAPWHQAPLSSAFTAQAPGYGAVLTSLLQKYQPYLDAIRPVSIDAYFYTGDRQQKETFTSYLARKETQRQELETQLGTTLHPLIAGRVLMKQANLSEHQLQILALKTNVLMTYDEVAKTLRPLDRLDTLARAGAMTGNNDQDFMQFEDREYDEAEAIYVQAYNDVRKDLRSRRKERGFIKHGKRSSGGSSKKGRGKGRKGGRKGSKQKKDEYIRGTESELLARTCCFSCQELGHVSRNCPNKASAPTSSPKKTFVAVTPSGQSTTTTYAMFRQDPGGACPPRPESLVRATYAGVTVRGFEAVLDTAAEQCLIGSTAMRNLTEKLRILKLRPLPVRQQATPCAGIGGRAQLAGVVDVPTCVAGLLGIVRFTIIEDSATFVTPPLLGVSYLEAVGAIIDLQSDTYNTPDGHSIRMRRLSSGHRAVHLLDFNETPWKRPPQHQVQGHDPFQLPVPRSSHSFSGGNGEVGFGDDLVSCAADAGGPMDVRFSRPTWNRRFCPWTFMQTVQHLQTVKLDLDRQPEPMLRNVVRPWPIH